MDATPEVLARLDAVVALLALNTAVVVFAFTRGLVDPSVGVAPLAVELVVLILVGVLLGVAVRSGWRSAALR